MNNQTALIGNLTTNEVYDILREHFEVKLNQCHIEAEDFYQEVLLRLLTCPYDASKGTEEGWIYSFGRNLLADILKQPNRETDGTYTDDSMFYEPSDLFPTYQEILSDLEINPDSIQAEIIELMLRGFNRTEVAKELNIPYHSRTLRGLLTRLEEYLKEQ